MWWQREWQREWSWEWKRCRPGRYQLFGRRSFWVPRGLGCLWRTDTWQLFQEGRARCLPFGPQPYRALTTILFISSGYQPSSYYPSCYPSCCPALDIIPLLTVSHSCLTLSHSSDYPTLAAILLCIDNKRDVTWMFFYVCNFSVTTMDGNCGSRGRTIVKNKG